MRCSFSIPPAFKAGLAFAIRGSRCGPKEPGAAGAVALRLELNKATEWSVTARRAGQGLRRDTLMGAHGPGSSLPAPHERVFRAFHTGSPSGDVSRAAGRGGFPTCFRRLTLA